MRGQQQRVVQELREALDQGRIGGRHQAIGVQLINHLSDAVRVVLLGRPGSGKSAVVNMMLGEDLLGSLPQASVTEVSYGETRQVTAEWNDGTVQPLDGNQAHQRDARRLIVTLPHSLLKTHSFCEVSLPEDVSKQADLFDYALQKGQVFIWCSEAFDETERGIWAKAPDAVKDHSVLALTKADRQIMKGDLAQKIADLEAVTEDEFLGLYPVAALHGLTARMPESEQPELWEASGGKDLFSAVQAQVNSGRAAELDRAALLLAQLASENGNSGKDSFDAPTCSTEILDPAAEQQVEMLEQLQGQLVSFAKGLMAELDEGKTPDAKIVLQQCTNAVREIVGTLEPQVGQSADFASLLDDARDGEDMLMLLQVEQGPTAAEDAIFLMLQLKKEIGARAQA
ncbi:hypothetical protein [Shimia sp.]|uniref:hypothetical protein n=1 Tax=Shimia sp. TaxID=1954381 RepID=UPI003BAC729A